MAQIDTLAPVSTSQSGGWTPVNAATLWETVDDNSDSTYATWSTGVSTMTLGLGPHTPPSGMRRHLARIRLRGEDGSLNAAVRLPGGALASPASAVFPSSPGDVPGAWGTGVPTSGTVDFGFYALAQTPGVHLIRVRVEIDNREAPSFTADLLDGTGGSSTTITDTSTPTAVFDSYDADGLSGRNSRVWVTDDNDSDAVVFDTGMIPGGATNAQVGPLVNGDYTLRMQAWTTIGDDNAYASDIETLQFTMDTTPIPSPTDVSVNIDEPWSFLTVDIPSSVTGLIDEDSGLLQVERTDCNGTSVVLSEPFTSSGEVEVNDWTTPRTVVGSCDEDSHLCPFTYRVRLLGTVDGDNAVSDWYDVAGEYTMEWTSGEHLVRRDSPEGPVYVSVCGDIAWSVARPFTVSNAVNGGQQVDQGSPAGHDITVNLSVRDQTELEAVENVFGSALVLISPSDSLETWAAPTSLGVAVVKVGRIRSMSVSMVGTGPEAVV